MSKFNKKSNVKNLAGGKAYKQGKEMQLISLLLSSLMNDKFYEKQGDITARLTSLIDECDKKFCAKAIIYARREFGMRSVTHVAASLLAKHITGEPWAKHFYDKVVYRLDYITEILSYHLGRGEKISNAMKRGFSMAFGRFDEYQIAKYKGENNNIKLVDAVNMLHPKKTAKNGNAIELLVKGELKCTETWESMLSKAGNDRDAKIRVWNTLFRENKIGYMALLRNVRNIISLDDNLLTVKCYMSLVNEKAIHKSLVLPFRFATAYEQLYNCDSGAMTYISRACEIACDNVPKLNGRTLIALDVSGSMYSVKDIASLFASVLLKTNNCDLIVFNYDSKYVHVNKDDSLLTIQRKLMFAGGGTNFSSVFEVANKKYDRVIILSDMQSWGDMRVSPKRAFEIYKQKFGIDKCLVYSIDLAGYGTLQLPEKDVFCLAGFSEKIFDLMKYMEDGRDALFDKIKGINL
jgi:60 kDa SS-A/Ro ribonucleoprotein